MTPNRVKGAAEFRNVEYIPRLDHFAVEAVDGGPNTFDLEFGIVARSGVAAGKALV